MSDTFGSRKYDEKQEKLHKVLQLLFEQQEHIILESVPNGRYRAMALTELEKTAMVVNKMISRMNDPQ